MTIVRRIARPLLAAAFVERGLDALRHPESHVDAARPLLGRVSGPLHLPEDPARVVRASGAVMVGAGTLLATGRVPRLAATALAVTLVPTTQGGYAFWQEKDPLRRREQRSLFVKNLSMLGGALLAAVDTEGRPGVAWRSRDATRHAAKDARRAGRRARAKAHHEAQHALRAARAALPG